MMIVIISIEMNILEVINKHHLFKYQKCEFLRVELMKKKSFYGKKNY